MTTSSKKKVLIVSSYKRPCGIAQYVEFLEQPLRDRENLEIEIDALPVDMLRSMSPYAKKAAKDYIDAVCQRAAQADVVNIQLEPGLIGKTPTIIWSRLKKIMDASKKVLITYHTVPNMKSEPIQLGLSWKAVLGIVREIRGDYVYKRLISEVSKNPDKYHHIVNNKREPKNFELLGVKPDTVSNMPLSFVSRADKAKVSYTEARDYIDDLYGLKGKKVIGCFGFLSEYKGIETAVRALQFLPLDYSLLIVGGLHPEGIVTHTTDQPYIQKLINEIAPSPRLFRRPLEAVRQDIEPEHARADLIERVKFCGALNNFEFNQVMLGCDAVLLPYAEVGQSASGPAAIALDFKRPVYTSRNHCFRELDKYQPGILSFFEVGNHLELASKLKDQDGSRKVRTEARETYGEIFNVEARAKMYEDAVLKLSN